MKNLKYIFIILGILFIIGVSIFIFYRKVSNNSVSNTTENKTEISRTSTENSNTKDSSKDNYNIANESTNNETISNTSKQIIEEQISNFSTKIYSKKDSERQTNLNITSSVLNGTVVEPGDTFSFTETVGKATPERGYQKADIYDENGNKTKGYGGGNCQISSTLYNAVLQLPNLTVTERHPHSKKVPYVEKGKDAAVAYGSVDLKFINNYDFSIKIYCSVDNENVNITIVKLQ